MLLGEVYDMCLIKLRDDLDRPRHWKEFEVFNYIVDAINRIIKDTNIVLSDRSLPMVPNADTGVLVPGVYEISEILRKNQLNISQIKEVYWKYDDGRVIHDIPLIVMRPHEMSRIDSAWRSRTCEYGETPTHAIIYSGNADIFGETSYSVIEDGKTAAWAKPKLHVYPKPEYTDDQLASMTDYVDLVNEFNSTGDEYSAAVANVDDVTDIVLDFEVDGLDITTSSTDDALTVITEMQVIRAINDIIDILPMVLFKPSFKLRYRDYPRDEWRAIDLSFLEDEHKKVIVDYVRAEAFDKEGNTQDLNKAMLFEQKVDKGIANSKVNRFGQQYNIINTNPDFIGL